jgi:hypothetical protein
MTKPTGLMAEGGEQRDPNPQRVILRESGGSSTPRLHGSITIASVTARINYRFGGPVVARY